VQTRRSWRVVGAEFDQDRCYVLEEAGITGGQVGAFIRLSHVTFVTAIVLIELI
jgi:hypothetical protein